MKIILEVEIDGATVVLDNYSASTVEEAIEIDLELHEDAEIGIDELLYGFGGDVKFKLVRVEEEAIPDKKEN